MTEESMRSIEQLQELTKNESETKKRFIRTKDGTKTYQMGKTKFLQTARDAGALYKIGGVCLIEIEVFEEYLKAFRVPGVVR